MKDDPTHRAVIVWVLIVLQFLLGLGATICGFLFIIGPDGHFMQMPLDMLRNTPFATFLLPGIFLFTFVGIYPLGVAYSLFARPEWSWPNVVNPFKNIYWAWSASLAAGVALLIWIVVQMLMLHAVAFLHILYIGWGIAILMLTLYPSVRRSYNKGSDEY